MDIIIGLVNIWSKTRQYRSNLVINFIFFWQKTNQWINIISQYIFSIVFFVWNTSQWTKLKWNEEKKNWNQFNNNLKKKKKSQNSLNLIDIVIELGILKLNFVYSLFELIFSFFFPCPPCIHIAVIENCYLYWSGQGFDFSNWLIENSFFYLFFYLSTKKIKVIAI